LSPQRALLAATRDAAKVFNQKPEVGTLENGKFADLLILSADPLSDIQNLSKIEQVIKGGKALNKIIDDQKNGEDSLS
jgi:imidazolonepropionase-like amidohydrolase